MGWLRDKWNHPDNMMRHHPGNISMDSNQAGATMASRFQTAKGAAIIGVTVAPVTKMVTAGRVVTGSTKLKNAQSFLGFAKRPALTIGVHQRIPGAYTAMHLSKMYSKAMMMNSLFQIGKNVSLYRTGQYRRLGVSIFGPPGSLFAYDHYMSRNSGTEDVISEVEQIQSGGGDRLPSKPKPPGKHSYVPSVSRYLAYYEGGKGKHENSICRKGYRYVAKSGTLGMCVRK